MGADGCRKRAMGDGSRISLRLGRFPKEMLFVDPKHSVMMIFKEENW